MQDTPEHLQSKLVENMTAQVAEKGQTSPSSLQELLSLLSWWVCHCLVLPKRPFSWLLLIHRSETGRKWGHRVTSGMCCAMLLQKVWSWCMCGFLWVWLPLRNSLSVQKTEKHPLKGSSLSSPQVPTPENLADKSDFKIGPNILKLLCNNKHAIPITRESNNHAYTYFPLSTSK